MAYQSPKLVFAIIACLLVSQAHCGKCPFANTEEFALDEETINKACVPAVTECKPSRYSSVDGTCNHLDNPTIGAAFSNYARLLPAKYGDGISTFAKSVSGNELPNPRSVTLKVYNTDNETDSKHTLLLPAFGQTVAHDLSFFGFDTTSRAIADCCTVPGKLTSNASSPTCFAIRTPAEDTFYNQVGRECIRFVRAITNKDVGCAYDGGAVNQVNIGTAYLDMSFVYGRTKEQLQLHRTFKGGRVISDRDDRDSVPFLARTTAPCNFALPNETCSSANSIRLIQNPGMANQQIIMNREHNRIADTLSQLNPHWDDNTVFEEARKLNIAQYQKIVYYDLLPNFLGKENMLKNKLIYDVPSTEYVNDFDTTVDPRVIQEHTTAAYRFFHTQNAGKLSLLSEERKELGALRISDWFNSDRVLEVGDTFDSLLRGHAGQRAQRADSSFDNEILNFLFVFNNSAGIDLRATDIQRGRDHGLPSYNALLEYCGQKRAETWEDFNDVMSAKSIESLKSVYEDPEDVDLVVGGSLEYIEPGTLAGPTYLCILNKQFLNSRVGDRYFFENKDLDYTGEQLAEIRKANYARFLCDNSNHIKSIQPDVFSVVSLTNPIVSCDTIPQVDLTKWKTAA